MRQFEYIALSCYYYACAFSFCAIQSRMLCIYLAQTIQASTNQNFKKLQLIEKCLVHRLFHFVLRRLFVRSLDSCVIKREWGFRVIRCLQTRTTSQYWSYIVQAWRLDYKYKTYVYVLWMKLFKRNKSPSIDNTNASAATQSVSRSSEVSWHLKAMAILLQ